MMQLDNDCQQILSNAKLLGLSVTILKSRCMHEIYVVEPCEKQHIVLIPDDVTDIGEYRMLLVFSGIHEVISSENPNENKLNRFDHLVWLNNLDTKSILTLDKLKVCGGKNVESLQRTFRALRVNELNIEHFKPKRVKFLQQAFELFETSGDIDIGHLIFTETTNANMAFNKCKCKRLILGNTKVNHWKNLHNSFNDFSGEIITCDNTLKSDNRSAM